MRSHLRLARLSLSISLGIVSTFAGQSPARSQEPIARFSWADATRTAAPVALAHEKIVEAAPQLGGKILQVTNPGPTPLVLNVLTVIRPAITTDFYALRGQIRYDDVAGDGYLEMWSSFPGGGNYFSRTLGTQLNDPMAKVSGSCDWRPVLLPFNAAGAGAHPDRLTVNIVLPGHGTVYLTPLELVAAQPKMWSVLPPTLWAALLVGGAAILGVGLWAGWRWHLRYRSAEWRRMAALDS